MGLLSYAKEVVGRRLRLKRKENLNQSIINTEKDNQDTSNSGKKEHVIIANSTFGNTSIASGDIYFYNLLKKYGYNAQFSVCRGTIHACSMCEKGTGLKSLLNIREIR